MYSHTLCPVSLPFPALLPQGVPCKGLCQMRVFTVAKGTTSSPRGPHSWTKPCQTMSCSPARTLLSQSHCHYGDHRILWEWNHYMVRVFLCLLLSKESIMIMLRENSSLQQISTSIWISPKWGKLTTRKHKIDWNFSSLQWVWDCMTGHATAPCRRSTKICLISCKLASFPPGVIRTSWTNGQIMYAWL